LALHIISNINTQLDKFSRFQTFTHDSKYFQTIGQIFTQLNKFPHNSDHTATFMNKSARRIDALYSRSDQRNYSAAW